MRIVNIHEAKTQLSRLVDRAAAGESFIIARAGKPLVCVAAIDAPDRGQQKRLGFMIGRGRIPDDFDELDAAGIERMFSGIR